MTDKFDQAAFDAKYLTYQYVNEKVVGSVMRADTNPVAVLDAAKELWGWLTESVAVGVAPPINISDHIAVHQPATSVIGTVAPGPVSAANFADAINETAERIKAIVATPAPVSVESLITTAAAIIFPVESTTPPPSMRQRIMAHLHAMGSDGATISEIREAISAPGSDVGKRMREMIDRGEIVKDDQIPTRYWETAYATRPVMPPVPLQKHTKIDGSPLSAMKKLDPSILSDMARQVLAEITRPGNGVIIRGPMDMEHLPLGQTKRAFSELERLGFIGKKDGAWIAITD